MELATECLWQYTMQCKSQLTMQDVGSTKHEPEWILINYDEFLIDKEIWSADMQHSSCNHRIFTWFAKYLYFRDLSSPWCVVAIVSKAPLSAKDSSNDIPNAAPSRGFVPAPTYICNRYALYVTWYRFIWQVSITTS
jgi:hypothetical protein